MIYYAIVPHPEGLPKLLGHAAIAAFFVYRQERDCRRVSSEGMTLSGIDGVFGHHRESGEAWHEEIVSTPQLHEVRQAAAEEWRVIRIRGALNREPAFALVIAQQKILVIALVSVVAVFDPLLLHEFELPEDARVQHHEDNSAIVCVVHRLAFRHIVAVRQPAPHDASPIYKASIESESVARMRAANVRTDRALRSIRVPTIREICVLAVVGHDHRVRLVRRTLNRCPVPPAPHKLGGKPFFSAGIMLSFFFQVPPKRCYILVQFAINQERTVAAQEMRNRRYGKLSPLIGITQQELSRSQRLPVSIFVELALSRHGFSLSAPLKSGLPKPSV